MEVVETTDNLHDHWYFDGNTSAACEPKSPIIVFNHNVRPSPK